MSMEQRAVLAHHYAHDRRKMPDGAFELKSSMNLRQSSRTGHGMELVLPVPLLEAVRSSSLNVAKKI
uniref:Uncharacterized protein n=1 Tax=Acrobeloides nanus TaxID=290746 RepID=A0A914E7N3_9BILA